MVGRARQQVLPHRVFIQSDAEARLAGYRDPPVVDDWLLDAFHEVVPPGYIERMVLKRQEIKRGGGAMHVGHASDGGAGKMHRHGNAVVPSDIADLVGLEDTA